MSSQEVIVRYWREHGRLPQEEPLTLLLKAAKPGDEAIPPDWRFSCRFIPEAGKGHYSIRVIGNGVDRSYGDYFDAQDLDAGIEVAHSKKKLP